MSRKKKHPEHVNHERWLISYADFITLLFAFFVVMFAVSQVDSKKVGRFTESFSKAVGVDLFPQPGHGLLAGASEGTPLEEPEPSKGSTAPEELASIQNSLSAPANGTEDVLRGVQVIPRRNELVVRLSDNLVFESGNDAIEERARKVISHLVTELKDRRVYIRVEGHTDNRPIHTARYRSNWDLSTARATSIVARMASEGIAPPRLSAAGYGEFHPVATNGTDEGRKQNRRVDIVITLPAPGEVFGADPVPGGASDAGAPPPSKSDDKHDGAPKPGTPPAHEGHDSHAAPPSPAHDSHASPSPPSHTPHDTHPASPASPPSHHH